MGSKVAATYHPDMVGPHTDAGDAAISAELVACTLGARRRPELRVDSVGRVAYLTSQAVVHVRTSCRSLIAELAAYRYPRR